METNDKKLYRSRHHKMIAGVCAGLASYFNIDVTIVRLIFVAVALADGIGILVYLVLAIVLPLEPEGAATVVPPQSNGWLSSRRNLIAIILIIIGLVALVNQFAPWKWWHLHLFWPAILVIFGVYLIIKK
ncbi:MAG: PspC domain-containing protein [Patescibacteria group bacterium]